MRGGSAYAYSMLTTLSAIAVLACIALSLFAVAYGHLRPALLTLDRWFCWAHDIVRQILELEPVFSQGPAEPPHRRLRAEAALRVLNTAERCAVVLDSLEDSTACAVFEALAYEHQELLGMELLSLAPDLPEGTNVLARGDLAARLDLTYEELDAFLAANPEAGAAAMTDILPMTEARRQTTASMLHDLPAHLGSANGDIPELKMSALDMLGWLRRRHEGGDGAAA